MRIVGGKYKGRRLAEFKGRDIRPTSDQTRESLFNILQFRIYGKSFLDLFCGTGAVGIEAYSRGAGKVVLNDVSRESVKLAKANLEKLGIADVEVKTSDALTLLDTVMKNSITYSSMRLTPIKQASLPLQRQFVFLKTAEK